MAPTSVSSRFEREADDAVAEVEHLVEHHVGEAFDLGHAVADFADDADVLLDRGRFHAGDLRFDFLYRLLISRAVSVLGPGPDTDSGLTTNASHSRHQNCSPSASRRAAHAAVVNIAADLDAHAAEQRRVLREGRRSRRGHRVRARSDSMLVRARRPAAGAALSTARRAAVEVQSSPAAESARAPADSRGGLAAMTLLHDLPDAVLVEHAVHQAEPKQRLGVASGLVSCVFIRVSIPVRCQLPARFLPPDGSGRPASEFCRSTAAVVCTTSRPTSRLQLGQHARVLRSAASRAFATICSAGGNRLLRFVLLQARGGGARFFDQPCRLRLCVASSPLALGLDVGAVPL